MVLDGCIIAEGVVEPVFGMVSAQISIDMLSMSAPPRRSRMSRYGGTCAESCGMGRSSAMNSLAWSTVVAAVTDMIHEAVLSSPSGIICGMVGGCIVRLVLSWGTFLSLVVRRASLRSSWVICVNGAVISRLWACCERALCDGGSRWMCMPLQWLGAETMSLIGMIIVVCP